MTQMTRKDFAWSVIFRSPKNVSLNSEAGRMPASM